MRWLALLVCACAGCDAVFGLDESPAPCAPDSFAQAKATDVIEAEQASVSWALDRAVITRSAIAFEVSLPPGEPVAIDIGPYSTYALSLAPEGTSMLFSSEEEPPVLYAADRGNAGWKVDTNVPVGTFAGVPSADAFGTRRVLVRMRMTGPIQEYEDDSGTWTAIGELHDYDGDFAPNLAPNGLTMVYAGVDADGNAAVFQATRANTESWFGAPTVILAANATDPQLLDRCHSLFAVVPTTADANTPTMLRRYDH
jgi:hypothetical protein